MPMWKKLFFLWDLLGGCLIIIIIVGLHHYECVAPLVANSIQSGRFWARSTASVHDSPWELRSFCTVFIQVICGRPGALFQYTEGEEVKICLPSTLSIRAICPNRVRCSAWIISVNSERLVGLASNFIVGDEVISLDVEKHMETPLMECIELACAFLGNRPALWPIQENWKYTRVVEPQLSWQRDSRPPELLAKAPHCWTCECTPSEDVWRAVSWRVDESTQLNKFLHCANLLFQHCDGRSSWTLPKAGSIIFCQLTSSPKYSVCMNE